MTISISLNAIWVSGLALSLIARTAASVFDTNSYPEDCVHEADVAVIGGGSSGTYGAINLQTRGQKVILIEREDRLGGHANTYTDPATGQFVDYGVQVYWNISVVRDFYAHFGVPLAAYPSPGPARQTFYVDFRNGEPVDVQTSDNLTAYLAQEARYPYLEYSWIIPEPVPGDLVLGFDSFVEKYHLEDVAYTIYYYAQGLSKVLSQLTVNVFKIIDYAFISADGHGVHNAYDNNQEIFDKALAELQPNVFLSSTIIAAQRPANGTGIRLVVKTPGGLKLVLASKVLVSIPLLTENMEPFDLDEREARLFSQWEYSAYYTMLINETGLTPGGRYANASPDLSTYNIPTLPAAYQITETRINGLYYVWYGSSTPLEENVIKANVTSVIKTLRAKENSNATSEPNFVEFRSHTPFKLVVSAEAIENGFYDDLNALQGYRNTWYTGAAVISHNSALLWNFTQALIPRIIGSEAE